MTERKRTGRTSTTDGAHRKPKKLPIGRPPSTGAETRRSLLKSAAELMSRYGYEQMTLDDVAAMSNMTRPAIYNYFPSKRALAQEVYRQSDSATIDAWKALADKESTLPDKLRAVLRASLDTASNDPTFTLGFVGLARAARNDAEIAKLFHKRSTSVRNMISRLVLEAVESSKDVDVNSDMLVDAMSGLIFAVAAGGTQAPNDHVRRQIAVGIDYLFTDTALPSGTGQ